MHYDHYTVDDFLADESFRRWVLSPDRETSAFWEDWREQHPEKEPVVQEARQLVRASSQWAKSEPVSAEHLAGIWQRIQGTLHQPGSARVKERIRSDQPTGRRRLGLRPRWRIAASVALLALLGATYWYTTRATSERIVSTRAGETQTITLPDGSQVVLNDLSQLRYTEWTDHHREVWLEGEAFFRVKPILAPSNGAALPEDGPPRVKFSVHTPSLDVEVYGTQFNVNSQRRKTQVVLQSGEVTLQTTRQQTITMLPGDFVEVARDRHTVHKKIDTRLYTAWKESEMTLDRVPVRKIIELIRDRYHQEVTVNRPGLDTLSLTATLPNNDLDMLLETLSVVYQLDIQRKNDTTIVIE